MLLTCQSIYVVKPLSLSTLALNIRDDKDNYCFLEMEYNFAIICLSNTGHKPVCTKLLSIINLFKQLKYALEFKLSNFKKLKTLFFPRTKFISICTNFSCFRVVYSCLPYVGFSWISYMIITTEHCWGAHSSWAHIIHLVSSTTVVRHLIKH